MKRHLFRELSRSGSFRLITFFVSVIITGTVLLSLPGAWGDGRLRTVDALFTATSAVCVTGLITVQTAEFTLFGKLVILALIQIGGLGIMSFATILLATPSIRLSLAHTRIIQSYFVDTLEHRERYIIRTIIIFTFGAETVGFVLLYIFFRSAGTAEIGMAGGPFFTAVFHSVSAFCNAGFSLFPDSLASFAQNPGILSVIMGLIITGGLGFVVIHDLLFHLAGRNRHLTLHTRSVLGMTVILIAAGAVSYMLLESSGTLSGFGIRDRIINSLFQSVTPRTAGFNVIDQSAMSLPSKIASIGLMFIGGAPGSIAGGVKVTTALIVLTVVFRGSYKNGTLNLGHRQVSSETVANAQLFVIRAALLLCAGVIGLTLSELTNPGVPWGFLEIVFETFSAFGTVGLSLGITSSLSSIGKIILVLTMFAGRVGLITLALTQSKTDLHHDIEYASEQVMIG